MNVSLQAKHRRLAQEQARMFERILPKTDDFYERPTRATAAGDWQRLRGLPAVGRGVSGAVRGTRPGDGLE